MFSAQIDSELPEVARLCQAAVSALANEGVDASARESVELCLTEALNNVIEHGLALEPGHSIEVGLAREGDALRMAIRYQGGKALQQEQIDAARGPMPEPDPDDPSTWLVRGRGLRLINSLCERVQATSEGKQNKLFMWLR